MKQSQWIGLEGMQLIFLGHYLAQAWRAGIKALSLSSEHLSTLAVVKGLEEEVITGQNDVGKYRWNLRYLCSEDVCGLLGKLCTLLPITLKNQILPSPQDTGLYVFRDIHPSCWNNVVYLSGKVLFRARPSSEWWCHTEGEPDLFILVSLSLVVVFQAG